MISVFEKFDVLTDVFETLRLRSRLYFRAELSGAAAVEIPAEARRIRFHLVRRGRCLARLPAGPSVALEEGDVCLIPNGAAQVLATEAEAPAARLPDLLATGRLRDGVLSHGYGAGGASLLCGFCAVDEAVGHPALADLPPLLALRRRDLGAEPWVSATLALLALEADLDAQGASGALTRLIEVLLIQAVRRTAAEDDAAGFTTALADAQLGRALRAIHAAPGEAWTVARLATEAGMSRARFAERFAAAIGRPPMGYLTEWRLMKARGLLSGSDLDMAEIAERCGYASVPAFSSRFKRAFGTGPGAYRRSARGR